MNGSENDLQGYLAEYSELRSEIRHYLERRSTSMNFAISVAGVAAVLASFKADALLYFVCALSVAFLWFDETRRIRAVFRVAAYLRLFVEPGIGVTRWERLGKEHPVQRERLGRWIANGVFPAAYLLCALLMNAYSETWDGWSRLVGMGVLGAVGLALIIESFRAVMGAAQREEAIWLTLEKTSSQQRPNAAVAVAAPADEVKPMNDDLPKSLYEAEWLRRDQLQGAISTPLALLTLLGSALLFLYKEAPSLSGTTKWLFGGALVVALFAFAYGVYSLVRSYYGYMYQRIPHASQLVEYERGLHAHYSSLGESEKSDPEFAGYLIDRYVEAADKNAVNNIRRGEYLHRANAALVWTLVSTVVAAVPVALRMRSEEPKPQRVEITNVPDRSMPNEPTNSQPSDSAPATPAAPKQEPAPLVVPKPIPPGNIDLRTEVLIPKKK